MRSYTQIVTPEVFSVANTVDGLLMVLIGGTGLLVGPIVGAMIFSILPITWTSIRTSGSWCSRPPSSLIMIFAPGSLHQMTKRLFASFSGGGRAAGDR